MPISLPFDIGDSVQSKPSATIPSGTYKVDGILIGKEGTLVLLEGLHIGWDGGLPINDFERVYGEQPAGDGYLGLRRAQG